MNQKIRIETDDLGTQEFKSTELWGLHTVRGVNNFPFLDRVLGDERHFIKSLAQCKRAAALANLELGLLQKEFANAIIQSCEEAEAGKHDSQMLVSLLEGSGGTSTNMNINEVIANRAQQLLRESNGASQTIHPNDHVNLSQSTNDVYPAAMKMAVYDLLGPLCYQLKQLSQSLENKALEFKDVLHLGRTCLQDAQPMMLGQLFGGYASLVSRLATAIDRVKSELIYLPLGATAIGTGFGSPVGYKPVLFKHIHKVSGVEYKPAANPFDAMQNLDVFARVSGELKTAANSIAKIASDLILLSSGPYGGIGEIILPAVQAGSSIMPGKVNPVIPMSMCQIGFAVTGNDVAIAMAVQGGQLEINHFEPIVSSRLFDTIHLLTNAVEVFSKKCIDGIQASTQNNLNNLLNSSALATLLLPRIGYEKASQLVKEEASKKISFLDILKEKGLLSPEEAKEILGQAAQVVK